MEDKVIIVNPTVYNKIEETIKKGSENLIFKTDIAEEILIVDIDNPNTPKDDNPKNLVAEWVKDIRAKLKKAYDAESIAIKDQWIAEIDGYCQSIITCIKNT